MVTMPMPTVMTIMTTMLMSRPARRAIIHTKVRG